jgi:hypothetical protein
MYVSDASIIETFTLESDGQNRSGLHTTVIPEYPGFETEGTSYTQVKRRPEASMDRVILKMECGVTAPVIIRKEGLDP